MLCPIKLLIRLNNGEPTTGAEVYSRAILGA